MKKASTGEKCPQGGIWYREDDPSVTRAIGIGNVMPPCKDTQEAIVWVLETPTGD